MTALAGALGIIGPEMVLAVFAIFCRVGGCLMVMPGFASAHVPVRVRLYVALAVTLALAPLLVEAVRPRVGDAAPGPVFLLIAVETVTGMVIGLIGRLFFAALQTIAVAAAQAIGLSALPGFGQDEIAEVPTLATLFTLTATVMIFVTGQHWEILRGILDSYRIIPPGEEIGPRLQLVEIADRIGEAFLVALRIGSPFLLYSVVVNFAIGLIGKLTPQIPAFFIAVPLVAIGGLFLVFETIRDSIAGFTAAFGAWLSAG